MRQDGWFSKIRSQLMVYSDQYWKYGKNLIKHIYIKLNT